MSRGWVVVVALILIVLRVGEVQVIAHIVVGVVRLFVVVGCRVHFHGVLKST